MIYVIEVSDDKQGTIYPTIIGPFDNAAQATALIEITNLGNRCYDHGGYSAAHIISDETCDYTPDSYVAQRLTDDLDDIYEDDEEVAALRGKLIPHFPELVEEFDSTVETMRRERAEVLAQCAREGHEWGEWRPLYNHLSGSTQRSCQRCWVYERRTA